jgi:hypothetical protein
VTDVIDAAADQGVEGNSRITGVLGAILFLVLAVEGVTIWDVRSMLSLHVFIGFFVIPIVCVKLATTSYRAFHYYRGTAAFRRKGPPHPVLRVLAPLVIISTVSMLTFGVVTLAVGPRHREPWLTLHQGSFIVWLVATAVHVLGHLIETWHLTRDEVRGTPHVPRRGTRLLVVGFGVAAGLALGIASLKWTGAWTHARFGHDG